MQNRWRRISGCGCATACARRRTFAGGGRFRHARNPELQYQCGRPRDRRVGVRHYPRPCGAAAANRCTCSRRDGLTRRKRVMLEQERQRENMSSSTTPMKLKRLAGSVMDPRKLLYLATVIEQGSLAKAAKHLAVSQPALSKSMDRLESELRIKLLE